MTLINMLSWWQWALLGAVPPVIVLLYFLKLKRTLLEVPSTYLWRKSIEDLHVNSIWQRLRTSLLLFLQLLLVLLVMAALVRPGWSGSQLVGDRYIFLIDNSASMQSQDVEPNRLAEAKRRAADLIEQMSTGDVALIVSFSDAPRVEQVFTDNRRELLERLEAIEPTTHTTSLAEALRVAAGLANSQRTSGSDEETAPKSLPATLYLFTDGKFAGVPDFKLGNLKPVYVPIGQPAVDNAAITAFTTRPREDDESQRQAFARLENFGPAAITADVELYLEDSLLDTVHVEIEPRDAAGVVFDLGPMNSGNLKLLLRTGGALAVDDVAWTAIDPPHRSRVLVVTPGNDALTLAVSTESAAEIADVQIADPGYLESDEYRSRAGEGYYALVIYDQCQPEEMPQAGTLFIGQLPPADNWSAAADAPEVAPQIVDVEVTHPLMQLIDLGNVRFAEGTILRPPTGGTTLIDTTAGPLLAIAPRGSFEDAVLGAEIVGTDDQGQLYANTDWPLRVSFPVFVLNTLGYLGGSKSDGAPSIQPGQPIALQATGSTADLQVTTPAGRTVDVAAAGSPRAQFNETSDLGIYEVREAGQPVRHFAVNLFDPGESDIAPREELQLGFEEVSGQANWEGGRTELWKPLLLAVLCVLCLEWYIYNRRVHV